MKNTILRLVTAGCCVTSFGCGDDMNTSGGSNSASEGSSSDASATTNNATNTTPSTVSDTNSTVTMGGSMSATDSGTTTDGTSGVTDGSATDGSSGATMAITSGPTPECGNGVLEGMEECDDGNMTPGDGCEPGCVKTAECGNGMIEAGEVCDDGNTMDGDSCSADCLTEMVPQVCGNGMVEDPEVCDDGNMTPDDGCEPDCTPTPPKCGNGVVEGMEQCDDGNNVNGGMNDFCKNDCTKYTPPSCQAPAMYEVCDNTPAVITDKNDKKNALRAIGICDLQPNNSIVTTAFEFDALAKPNTWQVAKGFGSYLYDHDMDPLTPNKLLYSPREGDTFLMLSSGTINPPNNQGVVTHNPNSQVGNGDNANSDDNALPAPFKTKKGSANGAGGTPFQDCDNGVMNGDNDCSDTLQAQWMLGNSNPNDRIYFTFKTKVPIGTYGYTFDFVFCSAEWPTYVNTGFNDLLIAYQVDPSMDDPNQNPPVDPYSGNITFIPDPNDPNKGLPLTITALDPYFKGPGFTLAEPQLGGTGFEQHACSDWFTAKGGVQPGAEITVGFYLADMSDSILATVALLDKFRWDCEGCIPSEIDDCGVQQPM